jgi:hypothetical protein
MPDEIAAAWKDLELEGATSGRVKLRFDQVGNAPSSVEYDMELEPEKAAMTAGFTLNDLRGRVTLQGNVTSDDVHTLKKGFVQLRNFKVNGLPVTWASALLNLTEESLTIEPITGKMADGTLSGGVKVYFDEDTSYEGLFELKDASVKLAAKQLFGGEMGKTTGRASAAIGFKGKGSDDSALRGSGKLSLTKSNLWEVPFFSKLLKELSMGALPSVDFSEARGKFTIQGDKLVFSEAVFNSPILNLTLSGKDGILYFDGRMSFIFRIHMFSNWLTKLDPTGISKKILKVIEGELNAVKATGTAKEVQIILAPEKVLRALPDENK